MEAWENVLPNGSDMEIADAGVQENPQSPPLQNPTQSADEKAKPFESAAPDDEVAMADGEQESKQNGSGDVAAPIVQPAEEKDAAVEESNGNGCDDSVKNNQDATASPPSPEKLSTPLPSGGNVETVKNGFEDIEMAEAEEESELLGDGTLEQQAAFMKELETFHKEKALDFKPPKFYGELLNCLKLWRAVVRLGGYDVVTTSKLWRQVGESFHPPKTCTTVSWTFRIFYEKALLEYEKHKRQIGELQVGSFPQTTSVEKEASSYQTQGSGRARRDAAARAMQGWHAQRLLGFGEVTEPIVKDKNTTSAPKREKNIKSIGSLKHKMNTTQLDLAERTPTTAADKQVVTSIIDVGPPADWVKINVRETKDCFEVYALVPGLLREEVRVQSDPAGRLVITGQPEQVDNPWGITPFQKVVSLPARIDPLHTSAVVSLHGRLFVRVPFEQGSV